MKMVLGFGLLLMTGWSCSFAGDAIPQTSPASSRTRVSIVDGKWYINGKVTYPGAKAEGLLMNVRMVNATFEDRRRPEFDVEANTTAFLAEIPDYAAHGVRAFTLCLQGGMPGYEGAVNSAFDPDGSLRQNYLRRVRRVIEACDRQGIVVILGCYYQRQSGILKDEQAVRTGLVNVVKWIRDSGLTNVVLETANEFPHKGFVHDVLRCPEGQAGLLRVAKQTWPQVLVSASGYGDGKLPSPVSEASDFLLIHFNGTPVEKIPERLATLRKHGKPIVCNEDDKTGRTAARAAEICVENDASWGLMLNQLNQYVPFTFHGAADDPIVYARLQELTTPPSGLYFPPPGESLDVQSRRSPAEVGMTADFVDGLKPLVAGRWALWRNGYLVHAAGDFNAKGDVASLRKTWHALTVGAAIKQTKIPAVTEKISVWAPELKGVHAEATWWHVVTQTSGFDYPYGQWPAYRPGEIWTYSDKNPRVLCNALARVYGKKDFHDDYADVVRRAYFDAIGMRGWRAVPQQDGIRFHFDLEDMGRLGLLVLNRGRWGEREIIPQWFVEQLERKQTGAIGVNYNGPDDGKIDLDPQRFPEAPYGFMTWVNTDGDFYPGADRAWVWAAGAGGTRVLWNRNNGIVFAAFGADKGPSGNGIPHIIERSMKVKARPTALSFCGDMTADATAIAADNNSVQAGPPTIVCPGPSWETRLPEDVSLASGPLDEFARRVGGDGCIVKDGFLVKTWGNFKKHKDWASAAKPVLSTLLLAAVAEGRLPSVDAPVKDCGWQLSAEDAGMTFRHLANMVSGYACTETPGRAWGYNDFAIQLYAKSLERVFGEPLDKAFRTRLAALQFEDSAIFGSRNGLGVVASPRDFARLGWLWLNRGRWGTDVVLPPSLFDACIRPGVSADLPRTQGKAADYLNLGTYGGGTDQTPHGPGVYGFNFWFNRSVAAGSRPVWPSLPVDAYQANGMWNRDTVTVIPSLRMVVAVRGAKLGKFEPGKEDGVANQNLKLLVEAIDASAHAARPHAVYFPPPERDGG